jgi:hypothetical protein
LNVPANFLKAAGMFAHGGATVNGEKSIAWPLAPKTDAERVLEVDTDAIAAGSTPFAVSRFCPSSFSVLPRVDGLIRCVGHLAVRLCGFFSRRLCAHRYEPDPIGHPVHNRSLPTWMGRAAEPCSAPGFLDSRVA